MTALDLFAATGALTLPRRRHRRRPHWLAIADVVATAIGVITAGLVVGFGLAS